MTTGGTLGRAHAPALRERAAGTGGRASGWGWAAIGLVGLFIAISCWWLSRDLGVPSADAGSHLFAAVEYHDVLVRGDVAALWTQSGYYPPLTFFVGGLATLVGGLDVSAPVVGENLVYVTLLAAGCYGTGRLLAGPQAGFLAVVFALGSPLLIEQFHVFMIDAPEAAMVAASVWLVLASARFERVGVAALAGLVVGLGLNSKEQYPLFVAGLLLVVLARGGWRNWRGLLAFGAVVLVVAAPWYAINWHQLGLYARAGLANANLPPRGKPPLASVSNLGWYLWAILNGLLFAPLFAFAAVGVGHALATLARARTLRAPLRAVAVGCRPELLGGLFAGWLGITLTPHHDMRYTMPLIVYLAALGTGWIAGLARGPRLAASLALGAAILATTLGATFGAGGQARVLLAGHPIATDVSFGIPAPDQITLYADHDFVVSAPRRGADVPRFMRRLHAAGVTGVAWVPSDFRLGDPAADPQGMILLARFAHMAYAGAGRWDYHDPDHVFLLHRPLSAVHQAPCVRLGDGTGLWALRGHVPGERGAALWCPAG
ncbi:MAG TPA: glycosyltransferase family 39 protein [Conexibacter sp.]|nr:glycosyltransferase family 39 protein [Conexibacter sp.]